MDWSKCQLVEVNPLKVSGAPILKGTRVQAEAILENYVSGSDVKEIAENFSLPISVVRELLDFALHQKQLVA